MTVQPISKKLYNWASIIEPDTLAQAERTASMPFVFPHLALMPDAHLGKGATVGSVIPTDRAIIPAAVGVDIGCGMIAVRTEATANNIGGLDRSKLREAIERAIPLSAGKYNETITDTASRRVAELAEMHRGDGPLATNWQLQLGSLGSGNHFIEISLDEEDRVWLFLHSGSRGVGNKLAQHHIGVAQKLAEKYWIDLPDRDLAYLVEGTDEFWSYIRDLRWAQKFAELNREEMMDRVAGAFGEWVGVGDCIAVAERVNCHHNYTERERHYGRDLWVSRKGAINAAVGVPGLIPGSMGDASYVVEGLGNRLAFNSAPHGAGRNYSRAAARKRFTMDDLEQRMGGIEWRHTTEFLDEHPSAYKPIDQVMADAGDLVKVRHTLHQLINVKGD